MSKLIIGANSGLAREYIESCGATYDLILTTRFPNSPDQLHLDLSNLDNIAPIPKSVTHAVFFAGISSIVECQDNQLFSRRINHANTCRLIAFLNSVGVKCLFLSSSTVFSNSSIHHYEYSETMPDTFYGQLKLDTELVILQSPMNTVLRLTKILSRSSALLSQWSLDLLSGNRIFAFSDLFLSPVSSKTVSEWITSWFDMPVPGLHHLSCYSHISYYDLALSLANFLGADSGLIGQESIQSTDIRILYRPANAALSVGTTAGMICDIDNQLGLILS